MTDGGAASGGVKFFADAMLGKLARWLRILGYDVAYENEIDDRELVRRAVDEDRIILTRDSLIMQRRRARGRAVYIESGALEGQFMELKGLFGLSGERALTRCLRCNRALETADKATVVDKVPHYVYETQEAFSFCPECGRVYWAGTHRDEMLKEIERLLKGA